MVNIIIEECIPYIRGVLEPVANVTYLPASGITHDAMMDADALVTRTRTRVDAALLAGTRCRFVATATIGTDHIDLEWCRENGVTVVNAPGCNAPAVAQYVLSSIMHCRPELPSALTLGIVGVGHVGSIVARWAEGLGMRTLLCDPPRARREGSAKFTSLADLAANSDIITFHTPLTRNGTDPTFHLCDASLLAAMRKRPMIINAARGAVVDNNALLQALRDNLISDTAIDCWEHEPDINLALLGKSLVATPHIAGYSRQGKIRATRMAVDALTQFFGFPPGKWDNENLEVPQTVTAMQIVESYDPATDSLRLRLDPRGFDRQRNHYRLREEPL